MSIGLIRYAGKIGVFKLEITGSRFAVRDHFLKGAICTCLGMFRAFKLNHNYTVHSLDGILQFVLPELTIERDVLNIVLDGIFHYLAAGCFTLTVCIDEQRIIVDDHLQFEVVAIFGNDINTDTGIFNLVHVCDKSSFLVCCEWCRCPY